MEKTIREWIQEFPEEIRDRAMRNAENSDWKNIDNKEPNEANALVNGFFWADSPEGDAFWVQWHVWMFDRSKPKPTIRPADETQVAIESQWLPFPENQPEFGVPVLVCWAGTPEWEPVVAKLVHTPDGPRFSSFREGTFFRVSHFCHIHEIPKQ